VAGGWAGEGRRCTAVRTEKLSCPAPNCCSECCRCCHTNC
jgi:hypothetical protein